MPTDYDFVPTKPLKCIVSISFLLHLCVTPQLSINAFDYNCHVDLIKLLKQEGELFRLRKARQKMSELFPLTEGRCTANMLLGLEE